jgi:Tol biopolymer transport system component
MKTPAFWVMVCLTVTLACGVSQAEDPGVESLKVELTNKGWLVYGARSDNGTWDLFLSRPDGSGRRNITNTAEYEEAAPRFSPDSSRMLYRRMAKGTTVNHDKWGFQGVLMLAEPDGSNPVALGDEGEYPWASWSADGKQIACLAKKGISVIDLATKKVVRELPRKGIYQQLFWSPDGKWFCGTGNHGGQSWTVVRMDAVTGDVIPLRAFQNCTPDWYPDSTHVILSTRPAGQAVNKGYGYTQLWRVGLEGKEQSLLYGEEGFHIYGGALSPDCAYILFTKSPDDGAGAEKSGAPICIMRASDAPSISGESKELRKVHPDTKDGPVLTLDVGWEPCWTYSEVGVTK